MNNEKQALYSSLMAACLLVTLMTAPKPTSADDTQATPPDPETVRLQTLLEQEKLLTQIAEQRKTRAEAEAAEDAADAPSGDTEGKSGSLTIEGETSALSGTLAYRAIAASAAALAETWRTNQALAGPVLVAEDSDQFTPSAQAHMVRESLTTHLNAVHEVKEDLKSAVASVPKRPEYESSLLGEAIAGLSLAGDLAGFFTSDYAFKGYAVTPDAAALQAVFAGALASAGFQAVQLGGSRLAGETYSLQTFRSLRTELLALRRGMAEANAAKAELDTRITDAQAGLEKLRAARAQLQLLRARVGAATSEEARAAEEQKMAAAEIDLALLLGQTQGDLLSEASDAIARYENNVADQRGAQERLAQLVAQATALITATDALVKGVTAEPEERASPLAEAIRQEHIQDLKVEYVLVLNGVVGGGASISRASVFRDARLGIVGSMVVRYSLTDLDGRVLDAGILSGHGSGRFSLSNYQFSTTVQGNTPESNATAPR